MKPRMTEDLFNQISGRKRKRDAVYLGNPEGGKKRGS